MPISLQLKLWETLTAYRDVLLNNESPEGWEQYKAFERSLKATEGFTEWESTMWPMWADDMPTV